MDAFTDCHWRKLGPIECCRIVLPGFFNWHCSSLYRLAYFVTKRCIFLKSVICNAARYLWRCFFADLYCSHYCVFNFQCWPSFVNKEHIKSNRGSGGATPGRARSNDLAERSTALAQALAPPSLAMRIAVLR